MPEYSFILPQSNGNTFTETTSHNSIIIIGANGSGKSQLGAWIEKKQYLNVHRIGAQRSLKFGEYIQQKSYEQSTNLLIWGTDSTNPHNDHNSRWGWDGNKYNYTSALLNDFEHVLSALNAKKVLQNEQYISECKELDQAGKTHNPVPEMIDDKLLRIWKNIFPQRDIVISDGKVSASFTKDDYRVTYRGSDMSDGERVALYLIAQSLSVPDSKTIIIDEPEIHLHRSIMNRLWTAIERERPDCLFIYITHDTQFAANHKQSKKIWVKSFDGNTWDWEEISEGELPEQLLLDILGNRKPVIFVEGTSESYDTKLYTEVFNEYYIVPCGSCSSVIAWTKAMNNTAQLHDLKCYGIVDRDYRADYEIERLKEDNIYTLDVAEIENLFLVPEVLSLVNSIMGFTDDSNVSQIINYIIEERFKNEINRQVCESVVSEIKYRLSTVEISKKNDDEAKSTLDTLMANLNYDELHCIQREKFQSIYDSKNYKEVLKVFNRKALTKSIGHYLGINNAEYCPFILRQFTTAYAHSLKEAIAQYMPEQIPR